MISCKSNVLFFFFKFFFFNLCIYLFIFGCVGFSFLCEGFLQLWQEGATLHHGARASHHRGPSRCGAQAPDAQAQQLWLTGPVAPRHVGSSQTRARTRVPRTGRRTLNHCATREALMCFWWYNSTGYCPRHHFTGENNEAQPELETCPRTSKRQSWDLNAVLPVLIFLTAMLWFALSWWSRCWLIQIHLHDSGRVPLLKPIN